MDGKIELNTVLTLLSTILTFAVAAWVTIAKYAWNQNQKEIERRIEDVRSEVTKTNSKLEGVDSRLHVEEKATIRQDGDLQLINQNHDGLANSMERNMDDIKRNMATKTEINHLSDAIKRLDGSRRFSSGSSAYAQPNPADVPIIKAPRPGSRPDPHER